MTTLGADHGSDRPWGDQLRVWREDTRKWSRDELRDELVRASYELGESRGHCLDSGLIARWETGKVRQPQSIYRRLLAHLDAPLPVARPGTSPTKKSSTLPVPRARPLLEKEDDDMDRRRFLRNAGSVVAAAVAVPSTPYGDRQVPDRVDGQHVHDVRTATDLLYRQDQAHGAGELAEQALNHYLDARRMLDEAEYSSSVGRDLMLLAGELAVCVGWLSYDVGNQRQARELYSEAFHLADQAVDARLAVQAMEKMTLQSVFVAHEGRHRGAAREAVRTSSRAAEFARRERSGRLHALLAGREAIAHAVDGDASAFRNAIVRAWRELDRAGDTDHEEAWLQFVTPSEIVVHEAKGHRYLGQPAAAARLFRTSLDDPALSPRNRANYQAQLASTLATSGEVEEALHAGVDSLNILVSGVSSPRTLAELAPVRRVARSAGNARFCSLYDSVATDIRP